MAQFPIDDFVTNSGTVATVEVRLCKSPFPATAPISLGSFTEADFDAYERKTGNIWDSKTADSPVYNLKSLDLVFTMRGATRPNNVAGWYVVGTYLGTEYLLGYEKFPVDRPMVAAGDQFQITIDLTVLTVTIS